MNAQITSFDTALVEGANELGFSLSQDQHSEFACLLDYLLDWNSRMNLTAVRDPAGIAIKHILDSLTCLSAISFPEGARVLDVGTGAGFPGLALKIVRPDLSVTLLDSTRKKLAFIDHAIGCLDLNDAHSLFGRAEELAREAPHREAYSIVVARAVAPMRILAELCLPFTSLGGTFIAMKGPNVAGETRLAESTISILGGALRAPIHFDLPFDGGERAIIPIDKIRPTPAGFPRLYRDIRRQPV
jgi:16S rRNA (guanine527-N7)-methyltransferase